MSYFLPWYHGREGDHGGAIMRNFHLPLPDDIYQALREQAAALEQPATVVAREAIEAWLREHRKTVLREAIAAYAAEHAGTAADLDPALEKAGLAVLRARRRRR
jgi:predicted transcriptional regulator